MAAAPDAPNSVSSSQNEQLTAPPGWTKKLIPAKAKNVTLRKHDVVFIAPDGHEIPSPWHLRRYLKAHPGGPGFSDFNWSSGEESIRRSGRASTKEISYSEKVIRGKRNASEMDAGEAELGKVKSPVRKRAKNAVESDVSEDKEIHRITDELMHEAPEGAAVGGDYVGSDAVEPAAVQQDKVNIHTGNDAEDIMEEHVAMAETAVHLVDAAIHEKLKEEDVIEQVASDTDVATVTDSASLRDIATPEMPAVENVIDQVETVRNGASHEKPLMEEVIEQIVNLTDVVVQEPVIQEVVEQVVNSADLSMLRNAEFEDAVEQALESKRLTVEAEEEPVKATTVELGQEEVETRSSVGEIGFVAPINGSNIEMLVLNSAELQDPSDIDIEKSEKLVEQNLEVTASIIVESNKVVDHNINGAGTATVEPKNQLEQNIDVTDPVIVESKEAFDQEPGVTESLTVESKKASEVGDAAIGESMKLPDENLEVMEDVETITLEIQDHQKNEMPSLEPLMQREEQERQAVANNSPVKVEHIREESPNEIRSSSVPVRLPDQ